MRAPLSTSVIAGSIIAAVVAIGWLASDGAIVAVDDDDDDEVPVRTEIVDGMPAVRLPRDLQLESGIETAPLEAVTYLAETAAYGEVVALRPLLERRSEHQRLLSEKTIAQASLDASREAVERLRVLHREEANVSARQLQQAEAKYAGDRARARAAELALGALRDDMLQSWGDQLTTWALDDGSKHFERLLGRQEMLLLVSLRADQELPAEVEIIYVGRGRDRQRYQEAHLVSPAPQTDPAFQGETYFFRTEAGRLRTGMRVDARIPLASEPVTGVSLPVAAVIWYAGKPWVYLRLDEELFSRRTVETYREHGDSWVVSDVLQPRDELVVRGAQMLLSEEFHWQIPEEDND